MSGFPGGKLVIKDILGCRTSKLVFILFYFFERVIFYLCPSNICLKAFTFTPQFCPGRFPCSIRIALLCLLYLGILMPLHDDW